MVKEIIKDGNKIENKKGKKDVNFEKKHVEEVKKENKKTKRKSKQKTIKITPGMTLKEFADNVSISSSSLIKLLLGKGKIITINQSLDIGIIEILEKELSLNIKLPTKKKERLTFKKVAKDLRPRPPVVTIMGHVDHGKTKLLDAIRETHVMESEAGGITQHIGAYQVDYKNKKITFIDTPGHEAFTSMRARGAQVTDIVVIVIAADEGVMPQTIEAIDHAKAAKVPILIAINKIDLPTANPDNVKRQLQEIGLVPEEWGGDIVNVEVSAKMKTNLDELLEMILLIAEIQELKADYKSEARGTVIESLLDARRGSVASVIINSGILKVGGAIVAGLTSGKVRAIITDKGKHIKSALPSQPVEILGLSKLPEAGDEFFEVENERAARQIVQERSLQLEQTKMISPRHISLDDISKRIEEGKIQELKIILKGDVQGSVEAVNGVLSTITEEEVKINIIHKGVGDISETDVLLATASDAVIIGFNVNLSPGAKEMAEMENVDVRTYEVIYNLIDEVQAALKGLLAPKKVEIERGKVEVRQVFEISRIGKISGCYVIDGEVTRNYFVRVKRNDEIIYKGKIASLKRFKKDVRKVVAGFECGIGIEGFQDIEEGDILEIYSIEEQSP